ncbi:hormogonium tapered terminus morphoprotein TftA [Egbenema bharatensis]|uniref:hormogonium tapered terminus morphoprotein TftA n=1 Tax=Egbenema bharatensis TaxID=3463334 RepID=UPI003A89A3E4
MGRIFVSAGQSDLPQQQDLNSVGLTTTAGKEMIGVRDLVVQNLRSRNYEAVAVPDALGSSQMMDWLNHRARPGDVALEIQVAPLYETNTRGASVFYIANNEIRKSQAEQLLQTYLRRVPQLSSRGVKSDIYADLGQASFCRQAMIPALQFELGSITHPEDRQMLQAQRQEVAFGIAEGLANWSRSVAPFLPKSLAESGGEVGYSPIDLVVNGAAYDDRGVLVDGNAYIPIDLIDQLGLMDQPGMDLTCYHSLRRIQYGGRVLIRAIDLREFNISVRPKQEGLNYQLALRSALSLHPSQFDRIMGQGVTSEVQMIMFLKSNRAEGSHLTDLPKLYREEANLEGVNYDIAFAQLCLETHFLRFGGSNPPEQNNFGGLGAIGSDQGASFSSPRMGVRAHIQHLKAYASHQPLVQAIVDPRFAYVRRGIAPTLQQLSLRWSADPTYHQKLLSILRRLYESAGFF